MIGIDLTKISRFKKANNKFLFKILTIKEIKEYQKSLNKPKFLAAHWAIKEALYKADNSLFVFNKIELEKKNGKYLYSGYIISTTSEKNYYQAIVLQKEK